MACEWQSSLSYAFRLLRQGASKHPPAHTRPAGRVGTPARASSSALSDNPTRDFACSTPRRRGPPPPLPHRRADSPTKGNLVSASPPRMRGKVPDAQGARECDGFTPAHVGKRASKASISPLRAVHPRACGEKFLHGVAESDPKGSPPRMRGKAAKTLKPCTRGRFTPAHAGKSAAQPSCIRSGAGSPPRMRGKAGAQPDMLAAIRFTPAHAGKSVER